MMPNGEVGEVTGPDSKEDTITTEKQTKIDETQSNAVLGLVTILIGKRKELDAFEKSAERFLASLGAKDSTGIGGWRIQDAVQECSFNEGDDPEQAAEVLLASLNLEVGE